MRVALNAKLLSNPALRGWNRYTLNLAAGLADLGVDLFLYAHSPCDPEHLAQLAASSITLRQAPEMNYLRWEQQWIPRQCRLDRIEVFHSPVHFGLPQWRGVPCVLTLHDAIEELPYGRMESLSGSQQITRLLGWMARRRADHIVTVSEHSRHDLIQCFRLPEERVTVTYEAADERFHQAIPESARQFVREKYRLPQQYVFYVGSLERRKNIPFLLKALAVASLPDLHIVIAGGNDHDGDALRQLASSLGIADRVSVLGRVDDDDLPALYAEARSLVYPSEYEGFGLQICEALAVGCPVLAADATSLPEILGDGGDLFSLEDPQQLAAMLVRLQQDLGYRTDLQQRAKIRSRVFSWRNTAQKTLAVYENLRAGKRAATA